MKRAVVSVVLLLAVFAVGYGYLDRGVGERVRDAAGLMSGEQQARLNQYHGYLLRDYDIDYRIVTLRSGDDINAYALRAFEESGVGSESRAGHGLLLVIDAEQNQVRVEVSQSLEGVFPDAFIAYLEQRQMTPFFAAGRVADGILATTELITTRAQNAQANAGFVGEAWAPVAAGAGATAGARLGEGRDESFRQGAEVRAGEIPEETLQAYMAAQSARNGSPGLDIYTAETRTFLSQWVVTAAQMDNQVNTLRQCHPEPTRISADGAYAVIRYPLEERQCPPYFFARGDDARWRLDLATANHAIRFGRNNAWRFYTKRTPYHFAFDDWAFDVNGFPQKVRWGLAFGDRPEGVIATGVEGGSPAERLGLRIGDQLLAWDGEPIRDHRHLSWLLDKTAPGAKVTLRIVRAGKELGLTGESPPRAE